MKGPYALATGITRRRVLTAAALGAASWPLRRAQAHGSFGPVEPGLAAPAVRLQDTEGKRTDLPSTLNGHVTALQLMFTGCSATCPIQGTMFAEAQQQLGRDNAGVRLLSISIDPLGDDLKAMTAWLARFGARPWRWSAAVPRVQDLDRLIDFLRGRAPGFDRHTAQAFVFDRKARLVFRTEDMPTPSELVRLMQRIDARD